MLSFDSRSVIMGSSSESFHNLNPEFRPDVINTRPDSTSSSEEIRQAHAAKARERFLAGSIYHDDDMTKILTPQFQSEITQREQANQEREMEAQAVNKAMQPKIEARRRADNLESAFKLFASFAILAVLFTILASPFGWVAIGLGVIALGVLLTRHAILKREELNTDTAKLCIFPIVMVYEMIKSAKTTAPQEITPHQKEILQKIENTKDIISDRQNQITNLEKELASTQKEREIEQEEHRKQFLGFKGLGITENISKLKSLLVEDEQNLLSYEQELKQENAH